MRFVIILTALALLAPAVFASDIMPGRTVLLAVDDAAALDARGVDARPFLPVSGRSGLASRYLAVEPAGDPVAAAARLRSVPGVVAAMVAGTRELFWVPNDTYLGSQWYLQTGNTAGIRLAEAWDLETGSADAVIAVIDTGVDWSHPDLAGNIWLNPGEVDGNGVDDDGNGYVDDRRGWDCGANDADARPQSYFEGGLDVGWHGTHCAGIAAAVTDNGVGIAGAAPGCRIMPLKVIDPDLGFTDAAIIMAFAYAIENGADVLSMSFGGPGDGGAAAFFQDLVDQAVAAGITCVAAAGNNNTSAMMYPAACDGVISVGATDATGARASFSTYGAWVTVNAPGSQIWSTIQSNYEFDFLSGLLFALSYGWDGVNPYMNSDGTSMACPMVAGVVGLVLSRAPGLAPEEVVQLLVTTGDAVSYDQPLGVKVNAEAALMGLDVTATPTAPAGLRLSASPNPFNPRTTVELVLPRASTVWLEIVDVQGRRVRTLVAGEVLQAGSYTRLWDGAGDDGRAMPSGVYLARARTADGVQAGKLTLAR